MTQKRFVPRGCNALVPSSPFVSAEEAWFWYVRCQEARRQGARFANAATYERPCDPDDIYRAVLCLIRGGRIRQAHLLVLGRFGLLGRPPDRRCSEEQRLASLWEEALDRLASVLGKKGILA